MSIGKLTRQGFAAVAVLFWIAVAAIAGLALWGLWSWLA